MKIIKTTVLLTFLFMGITSNAQMPKVREVSYKDKAQKLAEDAKATEEHKILFPSSREGKEEFFEYMYNDNKNDTINLFNTGALQIGDKSSMLETELVSSRMGPLLVSFGTLISNSKTDNSSTPAGSKNAKTDADINATTDAFQRLRANGGNVYLNVDYPVFCFTSHWATVYSNLYTKGGLVFTNVSNDVETSSGNGSTGCNLYLSAADEAKKFIFFVNANFGYHYGASDFYQKLNLKDQKAFGFGQISAGVSVSKALRFEYTFKTVSSDENLRTQKGVIGVQILKTLF